MIGLDSVLGFITILVWTWLSTLILGPDSTLCKPGGQVISSAPSALILHWVPFQFSQKTIEHLKKDISRAISSPCVDVIIPWRAPYRPPTPTHPLLLYQAVHLRERGCSIQDLESMAFPDLTFPSIMDGWREGREKGERKGWRSERDLCWV